MTGQIDTAVDFLKEWLNPLRRVAIIAGAGVSIDPPACLPSGSDLIATIINQVTSPDSLSRMALTRFTNPQRNDRRSPEDYLRLERILQILWDRDARSLDLLRFFAEFFLPNRNHYALAMLAASGHVVLTTNFDHAIETAAEQIGLPLKSCFLEGDYERLNVELLPASLLLKLHGDALYDADVSPENRSVAAILHDIEQGGQLQASAKWRTVREISQRFDLVVLGYSGTDDLDVIPTLLNNNATQRVLWVQHGSPSLLWTPDRLAREPKDASGEPLFPAARVVGEFRRLRGADRVTLIETPTAAAVETLVATLVNPEFSKAAERSSVFLQRAIPHHGMGSAIARQKLVAKTSHLQNFIAMESILAAEMLLSIGRFSEAESLLGPLRDCPEGSAEEPLLRCLLASQLLRRYGYHEAASSYVSKAAALVPFDRADMEEAVEQEQAAVNLGLGQGDTPRVGSNRTARGASGDASPQFGHEATSHNTQGFLLLQEGCREDARREFEKALDICLRIGDEVGVAIVKNNLGLTFQHENWSKVIEYSREAMEIYERHRLFHSAVEARCQLGVAFLESGNHADAATSFQEVLRLWHYSRDRLNLATACHGLGAIALEEFKVREAFLFYTKAKLLYEGSAPSQTRDNLQLDLEIVEGLIMPETRCDLEKQAEVEVQALCEGEV